jgi:hypothetical protein
MRKLTIIAMLMTACSLSGRVMAFYDQSPAELKSDQSKFREEVSFSLSFDQFLQAAYVAQTTCKDSVNFVVSPDRTSATATLNIPGMSAMATVALAEARPNATGTVVKVWAQNGGFAHAMLTPIHQIGVPPKCRS